jgi:hypothetical protein
MEARPVLWISEICVFAVDDEFELMSNFLHKNKQRNRAASLPASEVQLPPSEELPPPLPSPRLPHSRHASMDTSNALVTPRRTSQQQQQMLASLGASSELLQARNKLTGWFANMLPSKPSPAVNRSPSKPNFNGGSTRSIKNPLNAIDRKWFDKAGLPSSCWKIL